MNARKPRPTKSEIAAKEFCANIQKYGNADFGVEWKKSSMWGLCPRIEWGGDTVARASGCGYCKHSSVLAEALRWLADTDEARHAIHATMGAGVRSVQTALLAIGWDLQPTACGKTFDGYRITRVADVAKAA